METQSTFMSKLTAFTMKINNEVQYHLLSFKSNSIYLSEGCMQLKNTKKCCWLFELILTWQSHPKIKKLDHQVWKITRQKNLRYSITCYDNKDQLQLEKQVNIDNFPLMAIEILLKDQVALLPAEI